MPESYNAPEFAHDLAHLASLVELCTLSRKQEIKDLTNILSVMKAESEAMQSSLDEFLKPLIKSLTGVSDFHEIISAPGARGTGRKVPIYDCETGRVSGEHEVIDTGAPDDEVSEYSVGDGKVQVAIPRFIANRIVANKEKLGDVVNRVFKQGKADKVKTFEEFECILDNYVAEVSTILNISMNEARIVLKTLVATAHFE